MRGEGAAPETRDGFSGLVVVALVTGALLGSVWWAVLRPSALRSAGVDRGSAAGASGPWDTRGAAWLDAVVRIRTTRCSDAVEGTGVIVGGSVLTNRHVVDGATSVVVTTHDGVEHAVRRVAVSDRIDVARLDTEGVGEGLGLASSAGASGRLTLAGFPGGGDLQVRTVRYDGELDGTRFPDPLQAIRLDRNVVPGESGSPVVDSQGDVVAMIYARAIADGRGLAVAAADVAAAEPSLADQAPPRC